MQDTHNSEKSHMGSLELFEQTLQAWLNVLMKSFQEQQFENRIAQRLQIIRQISEEKIALLENSEHQEAEVVNDLVDRLYWFQVELRSQVHGLHKDLSLLGFLS